MTLHLLDVNEAQIVVRHGKSTLCFPAAMDINKPPLKPQFETPLMAKGREAQEALLQAIGKLLAQK